MSDNAPVSRKSRRKRGCLIAAIVLIIALAAGWQFVERYINVERYLPTISSLIEQYSGLPAHIGDVDLRLFPMPSVAVTGIVLGEGDFKLEADSIVARPNVAGLLRRKIDIAGIVAKGLVLTLPEETDAAQQRITEVIDHATQKEESGTAETPAEKPEAPAGDGRIRVAGFVLSIGRIIADDAVIQRGAAAAVRCDVDVSDVLSKEIHATLDAALPYFAEDTRLKADVKTTLAADAPPQINGSLSLENLDIEDVARSERIPHTRVNLHAEVSGAVPNDITAQIKGDIHTAVSDAFAGAIAANVAWRDGEASISGLTLDSPGLQFRADAALKPGGALSVQMPAAKAESEGLRVLLALIPLPDLKLVPQAKGAISIDGFEIGALNNGEIGLLKGNISLGGIDLVRDDGAKVLSGISGEMAVSDNALHIAKLGSEGINIAGDIRPDLDDAFVALDMTAQAELTREKLAMFMPLDQVQRLSGSLALEKLSGTFGKGQAMPPADLNALVRLKEINASITAPQLAQPLDCKNLNGVITFKDGTLQLEGLAAEGFKVNGKVRPDLATKKVALDLAINVDLGSPLVGALVPAGPVSQLGGTLAFKRIACTVVPGQGMPADLAIEGGIQNGRAAVDTPAFKDQISDLNATFTSDGKSVGANARAASTTLGPLQCDARYVLADSSVKGTVGVDLPRAAQPFVPDGPAQVYGVPILKTYGQSTFEISAVLPGADHPGATVSIARQGAPALNVELSLVPLNDTLSLGPLSFSSDVPLEALAAVMPAGIQAEGPAKVSARIDMGSSSFRASMDFAGTSLKLPEYIEKKPGDELLVEVTGGGPDTPFAPQSADVTVLGEKIAVQLAGGAVRIPDLNLNLQAFSRLMAKGGKTSGRVSGSVEVSPLNIALRLNDAGIALAPEVAIDSATGAVNYSDGKIVVDNLRIKGADSDCTINAGYKGSALDAQITGAKLNVNAIQAMYNAAQPMMGSGETASGSAPASPAPAAPAPANPPASESPAKAGLTGTAKIDLQSVYYGRGRMDNVRGTVQFTPEGIDVSDLSFKPYSGEINGTVQMAYGQGGAPGTLATKLNLKDVDLKFLDDVAFAEPRGLTGTATGSLNVKMPLASGKALFQGMDALVDITAYKGSFGKLGYATKLLSVLKTTEIVRLRLPKLHDRGLTFDTTVLKMQSQQGVMKLEKFSLTDKSYAIDGGGGLDFLKDDMDVTLGMNFLESVTGIADKVPVLSQASTVLKKGTALRIRALGSPFDPKVNLEALPGVVGEGKDKVAPVVNSVLGVVGIGKKAPAEAPATTTPESATSTETAPATPETAPEPPPAEQEQTQKSDDKVTPIVEGVLGIIGGDKESDKKSEEGAESKDGAASESSKKKDKVTPIVNGVLGILGGDKQ